MHSKDTGSRLTHHRLAELRAIKDNSKRIFGKDITNVNKRSKNYSIHENPAPKVQAKPRSMSFKKDLQEKQVKCKDLATQYYTQIVRFMMKQEQYPTSTNKNEQISQKNRQTLYDWIIDIHSSFRLKEQTLFLTFIYLNEFMNKVHVTKEKLQLVGITCLWIASKYQQIYPPRTKNFIQAAGSSYNLQSLRKMEGQIIQSLNFNLTKTTSLQLAETVLTQNTKTGSLCKYLLQGCEMQGYCRNVAPSLLVLTAIKLSDYICKTKTDDKLLKENCEFGKQQMSGCFKELCNVLQIKNKYGLLALKKKYSSQKYHGVSKFKLQSK